ncbi:MAG: Flp pilus assembly protein CpaB [Pirellulales bacterium]|nr:Flp pilus assembly protein CpaB [Pirellulales bacterium]
MSKGTEAAAPSGETVDVYVAKMDIPQNDLIDVASMLKLEPWPKDKVPPGALTKLADVKERRARQPIVAEDIILEKKLLPKGEAGSRASDQVLPGYRLIGIKVDAVATSGNLIKPGDRVDLMVHLPKNPSNGIPETVTKTFLQDVKVFAVNSTTTDADQEGSISAKTVTLEVTPTEAEAVTFCQSVGKIMLTARRPQDEKSETASGYGIKDLLSDGTDDSDRADENSVFASLFGRKEDTDNSQSGGIFGSIGTATPNADQQVAVIPQGDNHQIKILRGFDDAEVIQINQNGEPVRPGAEPTQFNQNNGQSLSFPAFGTPGSFDGNATDDASGSSDDMDSFVDDEGSIEDAN